MGRMAYVFVFMIESASPHIYCRYIMLFKILKSVEKLQADMWTNKITKITGAFFCRP